MRKLELDEYFYERFEEANSVGGYENDGMLYLFIACHPGLTEDEIFRECDHGSKECLEMFKEAGFATAEDGKWFAR